MPDSPNTRVPRRMSPSAEKCDFWLICPSDLKRVAAPGVPAFIGYICTHYPFQRIWPIDEKSIRTRGLFPLMSNIELLAIGKMVNSSEAMFDRRRRILREARKMISRGGLDGF